MSVSDLVTSESGLNFAATLFSAAWTFFKGREWYQDAKNQRSAAALDALEAGVAKTYQTYVIAVKEASADGKLTMQERRQAREMAKKSAVEFGMSQGVDVMRELGSQYMDLWIERMVTRAKQQS